MTTVYVFARAPVLGQVKTRLAAGIGDRQALDFYVATLRRTVSVLAADTRWRTVLAVTPDSSADDPNVWPEGVARVAQGEGDLGARMMRCLGPAPALVVGSDIPGIEAAHIADAIEKLADHDMVFGPAEDGGFWLVGTAGPPPATIFENVRWSSEHALADTLAGLDGHSVARVATLWDVDDEAGFRRWRGSGRRTFRRP
ncbi:MAG: TIGR04282 family arsenosugar biosynthesis glycosyltransferase [Alphaproteobacteria bacterium]